MRPVRCLGSHLPFANEAFDAVVVSDVIEHVPPEQRQSVITEVLRVSRALVVFGYPCGLLACALDRNLHKEYLERGIAPPPWLEEHMMHPFPDKDLFLKPPVGWNVKSVPNENLDFHYRMMKLEMHASLNYLFRFCLWIMPGVIERLLRRMDGQPSYRMIFVLSRQ
jgi:SAM-dependent methyltransferase